MIGAKDVLPTPARAIGARVLPKGVNYRVWAPGHAQLAVTIERAGLSRRLALEPEENGFWQIIDGEGRAGDRYTFELDADRQRPDCASRFQPQGVHGPSECIDASTFPWQCHDWVRPPWTGQTIYEIHVGTLTEAGTFRGAIARLDHIRDLGADAIEIMPVADFAGDRNWGYDGVSLYAPARCYGRPDDLRALVDAAHARGLAVILDVVYNHLGPAGNYLADFSPDYFRHDEKTPWGSAFNLDGPQSRPVRDFIVGNAVYWLDEFRFDGLRLDATHAIPDRSDQHLLEEIASAIHQRGGFLIAEDDRNEAKILNTADDPRTGFDAAWADDFHHQIRVALTGIQSTYFAAYHGTAADLADLLVHGWSYRGQPYAPWGGKNRGTTSDHLPAKAFVVCIENHDQVGNRARGERLEHLITPGEFRAASMLFCLNPYAPLIFMGQEWGASTPFRFFTDHGGELGSQVSAGRQREFGQHGESWETGSFPDPEARATFVDSKLRWPERNEEGHSEILALYRECLGERRRSLDAFALQRKNWQVHHSGNLVAVRYQGSEGERMLVASLKEEALSIRNLPSLFEPPENHVWQVVLHSEESRFGGNFTQWTFEHLPTPGPATVWLAAVKKEHRRGTA